MQPSRLKEILDAVRGQKDLVTHDVDGDGDKETFCNIALDRVLGLCGIPRMVYKLNGQPLMANAMIDFMRSSVNWELVSGEVATARASVGTLVVAAQQADGHGHVAPVYPSPMEHSGSWGKYVPMLSNVGRQNAVLKSSMCFRTEPEYFSRRMSEA
jgi:hypothetical protein